ncbi:MAG: protein-glutamate O-methyltransferase CheR [Planctomycetota bacterium]
MTQLTAQDIDSVCRLVDDLCGIYWDESKAYLMEARLQSLVAQQGCESYADLVRKVRAEVVPGLKEQVVDAVTTNETLWFRDGTPFDAMRYKLVPELIDDKSSSLLPKKFRVWSAACSTGQEVYSIAITLAETLPEFLKWDVQVLGTDISPAAIEQASRGVYNSLEIGRGTDAEQRRKYFTQQGKEWRISDEIRSMCKFQQRNLHEPFTGLGPFDIIFARNVAIYFTEDDRKRLFERAAKALAPNGWVFVGSSESLTALGSQWQPQQHCRANCYRPNMPRTAYV